jgi:iron(III) transport system substrate-binding protein
MTPQSTRRTALCAILLTGLLSGLQSLAQEPSLNLYSARHYQTDEALYSDFTKATGIRINRVEADDAGILARLKAEGSASPADVILLVDAARLWRGEQEGLFQPVKSTLLEQRVPAQFRGGEGPQGASWFGLSTRARMVVYDKSRIKAVDVDSYEKLAAPALKGQFCVRSGSHPYNLSLFGSMLEHLGPQRTEDWLKGLVANMARPPKGGDTDQIKAVASGECGVALSNSYYVARLLRSSKPEDKAVMEKVGLLYPNQAPGAPTSTWLAPRWRAMPRTAKRRCASWSTCPAIPRSATLPMATTSSRWSRALRPTPCWPAWAASSPKPCRLPRWARTRRKCSRCWTARVSSSPCAAPCPGQGCATIARKSQPSGRWFMRANVLWLAFFAVLVWNVGARAQTDASAASASAAAVQSPPKPLPAAEVFFNAPDIQSAKLSPSGRWLAMTTGIGSARVRLIVFDLQQWKLHAQLAHYTDADIYQFAWVGDERLVYTLADLQSSARPIWWPGLYSVQRDGTNERQLVKIESPFFVSKERFTREPLSPRHRLLHVPDLQDEDVIVAEHTYTAAGEPVGTIAKRLNGHRPGHEPVAGCARARTRLAVR